ncbi:MAG: hypothetical protein WC997_03570 [Porticoccaceae bacterium]
MNTENTRPISFQEQAQAFASDPAEYFRFSYTNMHSLPREELEALQLAALQYRLDSFYTSIAMVKKMADRQHFDGIEKLEDVVPMLFEHTMYKSYPPSLLENGRFDKLTFWLNKLTSHDLANLDTSGCEGITDWVKLLDDESPLKISHSSGTSGVMSFNPFSKDEYRLFGKTYPICFTQEFGDPPATADTFIPKMHVVSPSHRHGGNAFVRGTDMFAEFIAGGEERVHTLYPGRLDSDVLYLAARIRAAKVRGDLSSLKISPALLARQKDFEKEQASMAQDMERFFNDVTTDLAGERVFVLTTWNMIYELAKTGLSRGIRGVFSPQSVVVSGGGAKGLVRPDDWHEPVCEFTGVQRLKGGYGMSEICASNAMCSHGHYHIAPWLITYVLDPDTSECLPRQGTVTGRAAFYDLLANSHWGGFITGDEITVHWDGDCPCGATSAYIEDNINRYSDKRGGDDKISCAATPEAHKEALDFLTSFETAE